MRYLISFLFGYFIGSFPSAYIFVKAFKGIDIRKFGSGNVGALNAYEVSGSVLIGFIVLIIDIFKGFFVVKILGDLFNWDEMVIVLSGVSAVLGHNFSVWISFYGGRGLATSLGVFLVVNPVLIFVWCILWSIAYFRIRNVHVGNIWATVFMPVLVLPAMKFFNFFSFVKMKDKTFSALLILVSLLVFIKHLKPLFQLVKEGKILKNKFERSDVRGFQ